MTCNQCGAEVPAEAAFCPQCGAQLGVAVSSGNRPPKAERLQSGVAQGAARDVPEEELWTDAYSPKAMTLQLILAAVLVVLGMVGASLTGPAGWAAVAVGTLLVFGYLGLSLLWQRFSVKYRLTTHRLVVTRGILSRSDDRILLVDIDDIAVSQGLIDRMLNVGTITLHTSDETTKEESPDPKEKNRGVLIIKGIENPRKVGDLIDESRRAERSRRGLYTINA